MQVKTSSREAFHLRGEQDADKMTNINIVIGASNVRNIVESVGYRAFEFPLYFLYKAGATLEELAYAVPTFLQSDMVLRSDKSISMLIFCNMNDVQYDYCDVSYVEKLFEVILGAATIFNRENVQVQRTCEVSFMKYMMPPGFERVHTKIADLNNMVEDKNKEQGVGTFDPMSYLVRSVKAGLIPNVYFRKEDSTMQGMESPEFWWRHPTGCHPKDAILYIMMCDMREYFHGGMRIGNPGPLEVTKPGIEFQEDPLPLVETPAPAISNMQEFTYSSAAASSKEEINVGHDVQRNAFRPIRASRRGRGYQGGRGNFPNRNPGWKLNLDTGNMARGRLSKKERNKLREERAREAINRAKDAVDNAVLNTKGELEKRQIPLSNRFSALTNDPILSVTDGLSNAKVGEAEEVMEQGS